MNRRFGMFIVSSRRQGSTPAKPIGQKVVVLKTRRRCSLVKDVVVVGGGGGLASRCIVIFEIAKSKSWYSDARGIGGRIIELNRIQYRWSSGSSIGTGIPVVCTCILFLRVCSCIDGLDLVVIVVGVAGTIIVYVVECEFVYINNHNPLPGRLLEKLKTCGIKMALPFSMLGEFRDWIIFRWYPIQPMGRQEILIAPLYNGHVGMPSIENEIWCGSRTGIASDD